MEREVRKYHNYKERAKDKPENTLKDSPLGEMESEIARMNAHMKQK